MDTGRQICQMQYLILSLYDRLEVQKREINQLKHEIRYLTNYCIFIIANLEANKEQYNILSNEYHHLYTLYTRLT